MMNNKYLLTVIIPVYNTEKYIKRCIDSILNQSFKYIKIIIINDNSTDRSSSIIHKFSSYEQVKIIENSYNIGQGESRNIGLNLVDTDYFCFLDSDDWVDTQAYETAVKALEENPICDIAIFGIKTEYENLIVLSKDEFLKTLLPINALIGVSWEVSLESKLMAKSPSIILLL